MRMKSKRNYLIAVILLVLCLSAAGGVIKLRNNRYKQGEKTTEITPVYGDINSVISTTGMVKPQNRLEVKPPIGGRIDQILVIEGQSVKTGDILALLSSTERAALLDAAHLQGEEQVRYWSEVYKPTPLIAPIDGEVIVRAVEPGQTVVASDAVIVLSDRLIVQAQVDETDIGGIKLGQKAAISLDAYPEIKVDGMVDHISYESSIVNNVTIYEVDIVPDKIPEVFRSGMSANVNITNHCRENILIVPQQAVISKYDGNYVLLKGNKGEEGIERKIATGVSDDINVEVISGLSLEDIIIVEGETYVPIKKTDTGTNPFMPRRKR